MTDQNEYAHTIKGNEVWIGGRDVRPLMDGAAAKATAPLLAEIARLQALNESLAARVAGQAEILESLAVSTMRQPDTGDTIIITPDAGRFRCGKCGYTVAAEINGEPVRCPTCNNRQISFSPVASGVSFGTPEINQLPADIDDMLRGRSV